MRRRLSTLLILLITIPIGLAVRYAPLHLPWFLYKYLGSFLWAVALYWFIATLLPNLYPKALATISTLAALAVEFSRLIPIRPIDNFRLTLPGQILLGRYFSVKNIAAYLIAIACCALIDQHVIDQHFAPGHPHPDQTSQAN